MSGFIDTLMQGLEALEGRPRQLIEANIASAFLYMVLGSDWSSSHLELNANPDPWMLNGNREWLASNPVENDLRRIVYGNRVVRLADALATILFENVSGFDSLRKRIQQRPDTKASFIETEIASMLAYNGCKVEIVEESGVRGQDFDLLATMAGTEVSVEVTGMAGTELSVRAILNKLKDKRDQVPNSRPAVLYLHIPVNWMKDTWTAALTFNEAVAQFMRTSKRFNMLVLIHEQVVAFQGGGLPQMVMRPGYHNQPRHSIPDVSVFSLKPDKNGGCRIATSLLESLEKYRGQQRVTETI